MRVHSTDFRLKVVRAYEGESLAAAVGPRLWRRFELCLRPPAAPPPDRPLEPQPRGGGNPGKVGPYLAVVPHLHRQQPDASLAERCKGLAKAAQVHVGRTTMHRVLRQLGLTCKKIFHAAEQVTAEGRRARAVYREMNSRSTAEQLIFVDETGSYIDLARLYAWDSGGPRAYASKPYNRDRALTMIRAIGIERLVAAMSTVAGMRVTITTAARLEYLSPYSPELSPMALARAKLKTGLRARAARTREALEEAWTAVLTCKNRELTNRQCPMNYDFTLPFAVRPRRYHC